MSGKEGSEEIFIMSSFLNLSLSMMDFRSYGGQAQYMDGGGRQRKVDQLLAFFLPPSFIPSLLLPLNLKNLISRE